MIAELKTHVKLTWLPSSDATRTLNLQRERQRRLCFSVDQRHLCSHCYLSGNYVSLTSTTFFLRQLTSSPYIYLCFPVDQYHLLYCGWPAASCFLCFQIEKHPSCFLSMLQYMQFLSMSIHAALMLPFFRRIQPRGIVIICFVLMSCSVITRRPATFVFPLISDWPAAFIIPFHPTTRNRRLCFSVDQRHLCSFAIRLTSSLYVSFVFRSTSTTLSFHLFAAEQQPLCFLCFRLLTTSLYVSNSCLAIHAAFMFPLFRGIPPRRIVIIRFVLCLVLHYSPTSSLYVSNVFR